MKKREIVLGGTGFLGQHICTALFEKDYQVTAVGLACETLPESVQQECVDVDELGDAELETLLKGYDGLVYALGPDDRSVIPKGMTAQTYFQTYLVERTERVVRAAQLAGVRRVVLLSSYFAYFERNGFDSLAPHVLAKHHPYVQARINQYARAVAVDGLDVVTIEIPYVLGSTPGMGSAMQAVMSMYKRSPWIVFGRGGTTAISVRGVARAVVAALEQGRDGDRLAVGSYNVSFEMLFTKLLSEAHTSKKFWAPPTWMFSGMLKLKWLKDVCTGKSSGLDYRYLAHDILARNFFVDYEKTNKRLGIDPIDDFADALVATAKDLQL